MKNKKRCGVKPVQTEHVSGGDVKKINEAYQRLAAKYGWKTGRAALCATRWKA